MLTNLHYRNSVRRKESLGKWSIGRMNNENLHMQSCPYLDVTPGFIPISKQQNKRAAKFMQKEGRKLIYRIRKDDKQYNVV